VGDPGLIETGWAPTPDTADSKLLLANLCRIESGSRTLGHQRPPQPPPTKTQPRNLDIESGTRSAA
jgi:hypothetical protein